MLGKNIKNSAKCVILFLEHTNLKGDIIMLKFQDNHTTVIATLEDFILTVYVISDDWYHLFVLPGITNVWHVLDTKLFDPEIITIRIYGEFVRIDSKNAWFSFLKRNYHQHLFFPRLCSSNRFNRTCRTLFQVTELLREKFLSLHTMQLLFYNR